MAMFSRTSASSARDKRFEFMDVLSRHKHQQHCSSNSTAHHAGSNRHVMSPTVMNQNQPSHANRYAPAAANRQPPSTVIDLPSSVTVNTTGAVGGVSVVSELFLETANRKIRYPSVAKHVDVSGAWPFWEGIKTGCYVVLFQISSALQWFYRTFRLRKALPLFILVGYSLLGAVIFYACEHEVELEKISKRVADANRSFRESEYEISRWRKQVLERFWEIHLENRPKVKTLALAANAFESFEHQLRAASYKRLIYDKALAEIPAWDFWGSLFYAGTIYTTIGYGSIVPVSNSGRILTIVYALFGVPMLLVMLHKLGRIFCQFVQRFWNFALNFFDAFQCFTRRYRRNRRRKSEKAAALSAKLIQTGGDDEFPDVEVEFSGEMGEETGRNGDGEPGEQDSVSDSIPSRATIIQLYDVPFTLALAMTLTWMLLCSAIFLIWEDWDYFSSFYFFFTSLTTIGLGDVVPKQLNYMIMNFGLVIIGLSLVTMCMNLVQVKMEHFLEEMMLMIQKKYQDSQLEGEEGQMDEDAATAALNIFSATSKLRHSRWILRLLGDKQKESLLQEWQQRAKMKVKGTQTERTQWTRGTQTPVVAAAPTSPVPNRKLQEMMMQPMRPLLPAIMRPLCAAVAFSNFGQGGQTTGEQPPQEHQIPLPLAPDGSNSQDYRQQTIDLHVPPASDIQQFEAGYRMMEGDLMAYHHSASSGAMETDPGTLSSPSMLRRSSSSTVTIRVRRPSTFDDQPSTIDRRRSRSIDETSSEESYPQFEFCKPYRKARQSLPGNVEFDMSASGPSTPTTLSHRGLPGNRRGIIRTDEFRSLLNSIGAILDDCRHIVQQHSDNRPMQLMLPPSHHTMPDHLTTRPFRRSPSGIVFIDEDVSTSENTPVRGGSRTPNPWNPVAVNPWTPPSSAGYPQGSCSSGRGTEEVSSCNESSDR